MRQSNLKALPECVPDTGTTVEISPKDGEYFKLESLFSKSYRAKVISVQERTDLIYIIKLDGLAGDITIFTDKSANDFLSLKYIVHINIAF